MGLAGLGLWWLLLIFPEAPGLYAFLPVEKSCAFFPGVHGLNWDSTSKILYPMIALRQKLPLQRALASLGLPRARSHLPLKHWGSVFSLIWKTTGLLLQAQMAEMRIPNKKFCVSKDCSPKVPPGQTGQPGLGLW